MTNATNHASEAEASNPHLPEPTVENPDNPGQQLSISSVFGPKFRGGVVELEFEVKTQRIKHFYRRDFVYLSQMLYAIDTYRNIHGIDEKRLDAAEAAIAKKMDAVRALLHSRIQQMTTKIATNGHSALQIRFPKPVRYRAPIISPYAREFMELLVLCDEAFAKLEMCHLLGLEDSKTRSKLNLEFRKTIRAISAMVRQTRIELLKYVRSMRSNLDSEGQEAVDQALQQEASSLSRQRDEEPEIQASVSVEADVQRIAEEAEAARAAPTAGKEEPAEAH